MGLPHRQDPDLLVGYARGDDAAAYRLDGGLVLLQTVDFFPPMVDDPYAFGQIAAANALSDIYAMGGLPKLALNLFCFPETLPVDAGRAILRGGADKVAEAGATLCGGHTIMDKEPKYGLCVTGFVREEGLWTNAGAQPGDALVLTKPLGAGVLTTAAKAGLLDPQAEAALLASMSALNAAAREAAMGLTVHACTDITGFGLVGHACEMALASEATIELAATAAPLLPGALEMAKDGLLPGGMYRNRAHCAPRTNIAPEIPLELGDLLHDPQTSGGLLLCLPQKDAERYVARFPAGRIVGRVAEKGETSIRVVSSFYSAPRPGL